MMRIKELYNCGTTKRFHTKRTIQTQTVADHSWGVVMILFEICRPSVELLQAAIYHDMAESETGDVPATAKWCSRPLRDSLENIENAFNQRMGISTLLMPSEEECLKWADMLELILYCQSEVELGNQSMQQIVTAGIAYLDARIPPTNQASTFLEQLR